MYTFIKITGKNHNFYCHNYNFLYLMFIIPLFFNRVLSLIYLSSPLTLIPLLKYLFLILFSLHSLRN